MMDAKLYLWNLNYGEPKHTESDDTLLEYTDKQYQGWEINFLSLGRNKISDSVEKRIIHGMWAIFGDDIDGQVNTHLIRSLT